MSKKLLLPSIQPSPQPSETAFGRNEQSSLSGECSSSEKISPSRKELKKRLISMAPVQRAANPDVLKFEHNTKSQERRKKRQQPIKLEPLVGWF